jgi:hypothetical protein
MYCTIPEEVRRPDSQAVVCMYLLCLSHFHRYKGARSNSMILLLHFHKGRLRMRSMRAGTMTAPNAAEKKLSKRSLEGLQIPWLRRQSSMSFHVHHRLDCLFALEGTSRTRFIGITKQTHPLIPWFSPIEFPIRHFLKLDST